MRNGKRVQDETKRRQHDLGVKYEQAKTQVAQDFKQGINNQKGEINKEEEVSGNIFKQTQSREVATKDLEKTKDIIGDDVSSSEYVTD